MTGPLILVCKQRLSRSLKFAGSKTTPSAVDTILILQSKKWSGQQGLGKALASDAHKLGSQESGKEPLSALASDPLERQRS